jgi:hypothetical protein
VRLEEGRRPVAHRSTLPPGLLDVESSRSVTRIGHSAAESKLGGQEMEEIETIAWKGSPVAETNDGDRNFAQRRPKFRRGGWRRRLARVPYGLL